MPKNKNPNVSAFLFQHWRGPESESTLRSVNFVAGGWCFWNRFLFPQMTPIGLINCIFVFFSFILLFGLFGRLVGSVGSVVCSVVSVRSVGSVGLFVRSVRSVQSFGSVGSVGSVVRCVRFGRFGRFGRHRHRCPQRRRQRCGWMLMWIGHFRTH